jgi:hypothetical protein
MHDTVVLRESVLPFLGVPWRWTYLLSFPSCFDIESEHSKAIEPQAKTLNQARCQSRANLGYDDLEPRVASQ